MAVVLVRTKPIEVLYCTHEDALEVRRNSEGMDSVTNEEPVFCTTSKGTDGLDWDTAEEFEEAYEAAFGTAK